MLDYAQGESGAHHGAVRKDHARPFHHRSAFVRLRPYASSGRWDGRDPLAGYVETASAPASSASASS